LPGRFLRLRPRFFHLEETRPASAVPWPSVRWVYSLLLPIALLLVVMTLIAAEPREDIFRIQVVSAVSGDIMPGTIVTVGDDAYRADDRGEVRVVRPADDMDIRAWADGFSGASVPSQETGGVRVIQMQASLVNGIVMDKASGEPVSGAELSLMVGDEEIAVTRSDSRGAYIFKNVPEDALIRVLAPGYDEEMLSVGTSRQLDVRLSPVSSPQAGDGITRFERVLQGVGRHGE